MSKVCSKANEVMERSALARQTVPKTVAPKGDGGSSPSLSAKGPMGTEIFKDYKVLFIGECHGIGLKPRGAGDEHIVVDILHEDDENWFLSEAGFSSSWMEEFIDLVVVAQNWMKKHAVQDKVGRRVYGYKFKKTQINKPFTVYERVK